MNQDEQGVGEYSKQPQQYQTETTSSTERSTSNPTVHHSTSALPQQPQHSSNSATSGGRRLPESTLHNTYRAAVLTNTNISHQPSTKQQQHQPAADEKTRSTASESVDHPSDQKVAARTPQRPLSDQSSDTTQLSTPDNNNPSLDDSSNNNNAYIRETTAAATSTTTSVRPRQVIAVSASKGPATFFNLARKFLVTDEICDLSALEGAIVSAADAAHLLERSKLAKIIGVQTSYVNVEPKRQQTSSLSPTSPKSPDTGDGDTTSAAAYPQRGFSATT